MRLHFLPCLLALTMVACATPPAAGTAATPSEAALSAQPWVLVQATTADGQPVAALLDKPGTPFALTLQHGRLGVANGCNHIGGQYRLQGNALVIGDLMSTLMACADNRLMDADGAMGEALKDRVRVEMPDAGSLRLTAANGWTLQFRRGP